MSVEAIRTPVGKRGGKLAAVHPVDLLPHPARSRRARGIDPEQVDDCIARCVDHVGEQALDVARNAWLTADLPEMVPATTVDRRGSGQQAVASPPRT